MATRLRRAARRPLAPTCLYALLWIFLWLDPRVFFLLPQGVRLAGLTLALPLCLFWLRHWRGRSVTGFRAALSVSFLPLWEWLIQLALAVSAYRLANSLTTLGGIALFFIGLGWATWAVDRRTRRTAPPARLPTWNPFHLAAWYFGRRSRKLRQSLFTVVAYACLFGSTSLILSRLTGCSTYESPVGGGEPEQLSQLVRIQKVVRKRFVINPYSSILFHPPPVEDVPLEMLEVTRHLYRVGQGEGEGTGFSRGTSRGKVRFIRLKYEGGDWQQDMDRGADLNLLTEYGVRTGHRVSDRPEPMEIRRLAAFPARKSPPLVYMTGQRGIRIGERDIAILRDYLLEKRGMLFGDNGGSPGWGREFVAMMRRILPTVEPIPVYLDHPIHRIPYDLPKLPYVARHGGTDALGWVVDGRLVAYYHPGDIGDAWADGHSGVPREVWESCYRLGVNIIYYAHSEYNRWLEATSGS